MTEETTPETFDINAWLDDAHLPEESAKVYKRGDLVGKITALQEKIKEEAAAQDAGGTIADGQALFRAQREYERALEEFGASALTVYVQAVPSSKVRKIRKAVDAAEAKAIESGKDRKEAKQEGNGNFIYSLIAAAVSAVAGPSGVRQSVEWSTDDIKALEDRLGPGQFDVLLQAKKRAESHLQEPDADFLHKLSGTSSDDTDD